MAKVKLAKKTKKTATPRGGLGCIVLIALGMILALLFIVYVMGHATTS